MVLQLGLEDTHLCGVTGGVGGQAAGGGTNAQGHVGTAVPEDVALDHEIDIGVDGGGLVDGLRGS